MANTMNMTNVRIARSRQCKDVVRQRERVRCSSKIKPRLRYEWVILRDVFTLVYFSKLLFVMDKEKFCFGGVKSQEI